MAHTHKHTHTHIPAARSSKGVCEEAHTSQVRGITNRPLRYELLVAGS